MVMGPKTELTLKRRTLTADGQGGYTESWQAKRKMKGVLTSLSGNERFITGQIEVYRTHKFILRYPKDLVITEKDKFTLGSRTFDIKSIADSLEQHRHLKIELFES